MFGRKPSKEGIQGGSYAHRDAAEPGYYDDVAAPPATGSGSQSIDADHRDSSSMDPDSGVKRGLKNRHLSMMALAGIIGPGLLVGSGGALRNGGPASLIIGFGLIGMYQTLQPRLCDLCDELLLCSTPWSPNLELHNTPFRLLSSNADTR